MTETVLTQTKFLDGRWQGRLEAPGATVAPEISVTQPDGTALDAVRVTAGAGAQNCWDVTVEMPRNALSDGTHVYLVLDKGTGDVLHRITIIAGTPATDDLRAEVAALRAELDQLRDAVREELRAKQST